ncbi:MAG: type II toxin-antitoxin system Phd/YefM family antitoxin [Verrucomicrobiota bacterium]
METVTSTEARSDFFKLIDQVGESHRPVKITGKRNNAILMSEDDYSNIEETLYLLNIKGMRESIIEGMNTPIEECSNEVDL